MDRYIWIGLNVINLCCTAGVGLFYFGRWRLTTVIANQPADRESTRRLLERNVRRARSQMKVNYALAALAAFMIAVASAWEEPVPWFVNVGTLFFTLIWVFWSLDSYRDSEEMTDIALIARDERIGRLTGIDALVSQTTA